MYQITSIRNVGTRPIFLLTCIINVKTLLYVGIETIACRYCYNFLTKFGDLENKLTLQVLSIPIKKTTIFQNSILILHVKL